MKHLYFAVLFLLLPVSLLAQEEGLEQEILNYSESRSQLISKGRRLLMDKFLEGDIDKMKEVKDYLLKEVQNEDYMALYPIEQWMIMYWTGEYEQLKESILNFDEDSIESFQRKIAPERDFLYLKLIEKSWDQLEKLEDNINSSTLNAQARDFLLLHLNYMVSGEPVNKLSQEEVNTMADLYLETHPGSSYESYIRNNIRYKFIPSKGGFGFEFFTGYGMFTDELSQMYNDQGLLGLTFDVEYQKLTLFLRGTAGFGKTKQDREERNVMWAKGSQSQTSIPEISLGYTVLENNRVKLSPFAGIVWTSIGPVTTDVEERPELENLEAGMNQGYTFGLNMNIKLGWETAPLLTMREDKSYWFVRVRYGYTMPQLNNYPLHSGNYHHITVGFGGMYRGMRRVI